RVVERLPLEHPELRVRVGIEGAVTVQVVGLEVEEDANARLQQLDVLELEGRELADDPGVVGDRAYERGERPADVAGDLDGTARRAEDRAQELGCRRLPVRARHPDERVR